MGTGRGGVSGTAAGAIALLFVLLAALAIETSRAGAQDALICRKRDHYGDNRGRTYHLGKGNDYFNAGPGVDHVYGGPGNDIINGGRGNDIVRGGPGRDIVCGGVGRDNVDGERGNDEGYGEEGNDRVAGGPGRDYLTGQAGSDVMVGFGRRHGRPVADGADLIEGTYRPDVILAGGPDIAFGGAANDLVKSMAAPGARRLDGGDNDDLIIGSAGADVIVGGNGANIIRAGDGDDSVFGGDGTSQLFGGPGNDIVRGGRGRDEIRGDEGDDDLCTSTGSGNFDPSCERTREVRKRLAGPPPPGTGRWWIQFSR